MPHIFCSFVFQSRMHTHVALGRPSKGIGFEGTIESVPFMAKPPAPAPATSSSAHTPSPHIPPHRSRSKMHSHYTTSTESIVVHNERRQKRNQTSGEGALEEAAGLLEADHVLDRESPSTLSVTRP
eukprot:2869503-Rhodomonas_salina.2